MYCTRREETLRIVCELVDIDRRDSFYNVLIFHRRPQINRKASLETTNVFYLHLAEHETS